MNYFDDKFDPGSPVLPAPSLLTRVLDQLIGVHLEGYKQECQVYEHQLKELTKKLYNKITRHQLADQSPANWLPAFPDILSLKLQEHIRSTRQISLTETDINNRKNMLNYLASFNYCVESFTMGDLFEPNAWLLLPTLQVKC